MGEIKQINIKNRTYYFYNNIIDIKTLMEGCWKSIKNHTKTLVFTILDILQLKKLMIVNIFSVNPLSLIIAHANGYIEENRVNKYLVFDSTDENKDLLKN